MHQPRSAMASISPSHPQSLYRSQLTVSVRVLAGCRSGPAPLSGGSGTSHPPSSRRRPGPTNSIDADMYNRIEQLDRKGKKDQRGVVVSTLPPQLMVGSVRYGVPYGIPHLDRLSGSSHVPLPSLCRPQPERERERERERAEEELQELQVLY